jgi:hypothetical protein
MPDDSGARFGDRRDGSWSQRFAGHLETGRPSITG